MSPTHQVPDVPHCLGSIQSADSMTCLPVHGPVSAESRTKTAPPRHLLFADEDQGKATEDRMRAGIIRGTCVMRIAPAKPRRHRARKPDANGGVGGVAVALLIGLKTDANGLWPVQTDSLPVAQAL